MKRVSARQARETLLREYPDSDVRVRREFGGLIATVYGDAGTACFSLGDIPGVLACILGIDRPLDGPDSDDAAGEEGD